MKRFRSGATRSQGPDTSSPFGAPQRRGRSIRTPLRSPAAVVIALGLFIGPAVVAPVPARADNVGTLVELEFFKLFVPTGYANTCQGDPEDSYVSAFRAGSVLILGVPFETPVVRPIGSAQMQGSELTDRGTCLIRYIGSVPRGITALSYQARDPNGTLSANYTSGVGQGVTNQPISRPDMPSVTQILRLPMRLGA